MAYMIFLEPPRAVSWSFVYNSIMHNFYTFWSSAMDAFLLSQSFQ